jgi:hypothetical protein
MHFLTNRIHPCGRWARRHRAGSGCRTTITLLVLAAISLGCTVGPATATSVVPLGAYAGYKNVGGVAEISQLIGRPVTHAMDFFDGTTWTTAVTSPAQIVPAWNRTDYRMTWGVAMLPDSGASLAEGASGAYDHYFVSIARYLVANHQGGSTIRLGWEFNGDWFPWSATTCPACFTSYWRHIVVAMRSVHGASFLFMWNTTVGTSSLPPTSAYPGDAFVDIVGMDVYDNVRGSLSDAARWRRLVDEPYGLRWLSSFARAHHKPVSLPEWGLGFPPEGGGDNPYFITHMAQFIKAQPQLASALYWNYGTSVLSGAPRSSAAFARAFG